MKKLLSFFAGAAKNDRRLLALCYAAFFLCSLVYSVYGFAEDRVQRMTGNVEQQTVAADAFTLTDLVLEDGTYVSQSPDPRMTLTDVPAYVRSVTVEAAFLNMDPGEFCLFYQPRPGMEEFDVNYRLWAHLNDDGTYTFTLPRGKVYGLRLDPGIYTGLAFTLGEITLNAPRGFWSWFTPGRPWLLAFAAVPALAAAVLKVLLLCLCGLPLGQKRGTSR